jgi:hypothetical protein
VQKKSEVVVPAGGRPVNHAASPRTKEVSFDSQLAFIGGTLRQLYKNSDSTRQRKSFEIGLKDVLTL